jgi:2-dehydropantoate 2-reductase
MRHAVLGAGGIGGLIGAALARQGEDVVLLMRPESVARYPGRLVVESTVLGDFEIDVPAASPLDRDVDVVWIATKATELEAALELVPPSSVGEGFVIPLLNGVDHVAILRGRFPCVVPGAIRVESEREASGRIRQKSPFLRVELAGAEPVAEVLRNAGIECSVRDDERTLLWEKLAFLAPIALATTALDAPLGVVRDDTRYLGCQVEALAVARAEGAKVDGVALAALVASAPGELKSSMQKDVAAGRAAELDAIAGPILRGGQPHGIGVTNTLELVHAVEARVAGPSH